jgi:hypothetical protein
MRHIIALSTACLIYLLLGSGSLLFNSCTKKDVIHDTTVVQVHDTTVVVDSIYDTRTGLVAYYTFTGGSLHDSSGNGNDIFYNSASQTADRFGNPGNAFLFDGASSYMQVHNSLSLNPNNITLMAIIKVNAFNASTTCHANQVIGKGIPDDIEGLYDLRFNESNACALVNDSAHEEAYGTFGDDIPFGAAARTGSDTAFVQTGKWYVLIYTYDGVQSKFYMNGELKSVAPKTELFTANTHDIFIGKNESITYPYYLNGIIDEIRIYNRAISPGVIAQLNNLAR